MSRGLLGMDGISSSLDGIRMLVEIGADDATETELKDVVGWAVAHSPVLATVRDSSSVVVDVEVA